MYKYSSSDMLFSSSSYYYYDDENQLDLLVFSNPFIPFFTTCSDPIDDIPQSGIINSNHHSSSLDHPFSLSFISNFTTTSSNTHLESQSSLVHQGNQDELPQPESDQSTHLSALDGSEVKITSEECQMGSVVDINTYNHQHHSYVGDAESSAASEVMQRSSSSCNYFDSGSIQYDYEAAQHCDILMDSPNFQRHATTLSSLENSFFTGQLRRVFSAGDLQNTKTTHMFQTESRTLLEEANFNNKVGRYSPEERKEKISKYRAKRSQRKFNKTIKYACRKTLADNRPRIRGRFARNDDATVIIPKAQCSTREDDEFWIDLIERLLNEEVLS